MLVLASGSGLGKAVAGEFLKEGRTVLAGRGVEKLERAAADFAQGDRESRLVFSSATSRKAEELHGLVRFAAQKHGSVDVLVNNAEGLPPERSRYRRRSLDGAFELTLPELRAGDPRGASVYETARLGPHQLDVLFGAGGIENLILSNTFRLGVIGLTKSLAAEFAPYGILVNAIGPGRFDTGASGRSTARWPRKGLSVEEVSSVALANSDGTVRRPRGIRTARRFPRVGGEHLHHRADDPRRRRHDEGGAVEAATETVPLSEPGPQLKEAGKAEGLPPRRFPRPFDC